MIGSRKGNKSDDELVREAFLLAFPNPERVGCPGTKILSEVAANRTKGDDSIDIHLSRCSPCTREFLEFKRQFKTRRRTQWSLLVAAACLFLVMSFFAYHRSSPGERGRSREGGEQTVLTAELDFRSNAGPTQRGSAPPEDDPKVSVKTQELIIDLPAGREAGSYDFEIRTPTDEKAVFGVVTGQAIKGKDGITRLRVPLTLHSLPAGRYLALWREGIHGDWEEGVFLLDQ